MSQPPSRYARPLTSGLPDTSLDLPVWVGQRTATFRFDLVDGPTGQRRGTITPIRDNPPTLSHDSTRTIPRTLSLLLDVADTARVDVIRDRVLPVMLLAGREYPLGRFMWGDQSQIQYSSGDQSSSALVDEMFIVDQERTTAFTCGTTAEVDLVVGEPVVNAVGRLLADLPVRTAIAPSPRYSIGVWGPGSMSAAILRDLAVDGDYLNPWMDNHGVLRMVRTFDPREQVPLIDWDEGNNVLADSITRSTNLLTAPNRYRVVGNGAASDQAAAVPLVGQYDVPAGAPHSITRRGFVIAQVEERQVASAVAAAQVAQTIAYRNDLFETVVLSTAPDPRHDGHTVVRWNGQVWQELAWSMQLVEGAPMQHTIRRVYR